MLKKVKNQLIKLAGLSTLFVLGAFMVLKAPQFHGDYIRNKVGSRTYKLFHESRRGGGTGFLVKANSGKTYVLTNAHICGENGETHVMAEIPGKERQIRLRIIEVSEVSDLCLIEAPHDAKSGLKLASEVYPGQELAVVGHPKLMPLTLSRGQYIGNGRISLLAHFGECKVENDNSKTLMSIFGPLCIKFYNAGFTNILALPGNSGSATVDFFGNVTGVLFAGGQDNWGVIVLLKEVKDFLSIY
jgi:S1-C subfamily serine protease